MWGRKDAHLGRGVSVDLGVWVWIRDWNYGCGFVLSQLNVCVLSVRVCMYGFRRLGMDT